MANLPPLNKFLGVLIPPPTIVPEEYDGLEYKWKMFTLRPAYFKNELLMLATVAVYLVAYFVGKNVNKKKADKWFEKHLPLFGTQFSKPVQAGGPTQDGHSDFFSFSTGRRAVTSLHTVLTLRPRHDLFQYFYQVARGLVEVDYSVGDGLELDFTFQDSANVPDTVWAIVSKTELRTIRDRRWDLSFTRTTENSALPPSLTVMSEFADVTDNLMKQHGSLSLAQVLSNPAILPYFRSLSLSDQPHTRPLVPLPPSSRKKHLLLSLTLPPASDSAATIALVNAVFQLVDVVAGVGGWGIGKGAGGKPGLGLSPSLRPETRTKLKVIRDKVEKDIKEEAAKEKREEAEAEKAAAKKKAEEERLSRLSAAEQKKEKEREKKRLLRKTQGKVKAR